MLTQAHSTRLQTKYGIDGALCTQIASATAQEIADMTGRNDIEGGGLKITYNPAAPVSEQVVRFRLDNPPKDRVTGRSIRYLSPPAQRNALFLPDGMDLSGPLVILTEGELKALAAYQRGLPCAAVSGVWNWRNGSDIEGLKKTDRESLIADLERDWTGQHVCLLYDSDITPDHPAWLAFPRLAEQLYARGAEKVRILSLPKIDAGEEGAGGKVGLDDYLLALEKKELDGVASVRSLMEAAPIFVPFEGGADAFMAKRMGGEMSHDDILNIGAIKWKRSESEAMAFIDGQVKGEAKRRALRNDIRARLRQIQKLQCPRKTHHVPMAQSGTYGDFNEKLQGHPYIIDEDGNLLRIVGHPPRQEYAKIANFALAISKEIFVDNGRAEDAARFVEIKGKLAGCVDLPPVIVPVTEFSSVQTLLTHYGTRLIMEPVPNAEGYVRHVAQLLGKDAPRVVKHDNTGWKKVEGSWVFLNSGPALGQSGSDVQMAEGSQRFAAYRFPEGETDKVSAIRASLNLLNIGPLAITLPLLAVCFLAVSLELFRQAGIPVGFCLFLVGDSGSYKTTLATLMLNHFGAFTKENLPGSFVATANSLERLAFSLKDVVMVIDDLYPTENPKERDAMKSTLIRLVREFSNRVGRSRCNPDGSLRATYPPRGIAVFTMELSVPGQSTNARGLEIVCRKEAIDVEKLTAAQNDRRLLGFSMRDFIDYLAANFDDVVEIYRRDFPAARELFSADMAHGQLPEHCAALYLAFRQFLEYAVKTGALTGPESATLLEESVMIFRTLGVHQSAEVQSESAIEAMDTILAELFAAKRIYMQGKEGGAPPRAGEVGWVRQYEREWTLQIGAEQIGWADDDYYYFLPQTLYRVLTDFKGRLRQSFPVDAKALWMRLKDAGRLETYNSGTRTYYTKKVWCEAQVQRVVKIRRPILPVVDEETAMPQLTLEKP